MQFAVVDIETLKEIYPYWDTCRKSNDGTKAIIHKEILDSYRPQVNNLMLVGDEVEQPYPFPLYSGDEINAMPEFMSTEEELNE